MEDRTEIIESLKTLGTDEWEIVKAAFKTATNQFAPLILAEAKPLVQAAAELALPGTAKKEIVFGQIVNNLIAKGIVIGVQVAATMIYDMIQVAYKWFMENIVGINSGEPTSGLPFHP